MNRAFVHTLTALTLLVCHAAAEEFPGAAAIAPGHPNLPNGYELAAHLVCEPGHDKVANNGTGIALTKGTLRPCAGNNSSIPGEAFDGDRIEFLISGLDAGNEYALGFTWWDHDQLGRRQSVEFGVGEPVAWSVVLPPAIPLAFHGDQPTYARIQLPVPASAAKAGRMSIAFAKFGGRTSWPTNCGLRGRMVRKRVVIVTGDDWTGHYWRATGRTRRIPGRPAWRFTSSNRP